MQKNRLFTAALCVTLTFSLPVRAACSDDASLLALRTRMMVSALSCGGKSDYNTIVRKHRYSLLAAQRGVAGSMATGGVSAYDGWVTELANQLGLFRAEAGDNYCPAALKELHEVAHLKNAAALRVMSDKLRAPYPAIEGCN